MLTLLFTPTLVVILVRSARIFARFAGNQLMMFATRTRILGRKAEDDSVAGYPVNSNMLTTSYWSSLFMA
jgi:hypothetical protein